MRRRILACLAVLGILIPGIPAASAPPVPTAEAAPAALPSRAPTAGTAPAAAPGEQAVTLITGDRAFVSRRDGKWRARVEPARRLTPAPGGFLQHAGPDGVTVIPVAAASLVRAGVLDRSLFDVTGLIRQGYGDAHAKTLPLLVASGNHRSAATLGRVTRQLPDSGLTAVSTTKDRSGKVFEALTRDDGKALTAGLRKVWLNGKALPTLDVSVPQVGAPAAWQAGHTGRGAKVAVLDTGYDPAHPDLAGVVTGERDFTGEPSGMRDTVGHGTHVASTVAGRGARYTGVAKDANLMIGKVCTAGGCPFDAIIAGMQWAAESGARVVNMSLGGDPTDGTDPLSAELNRLTSEHGTLFVVAAGNSGRLPNARVSAPASADAALAVGSVSKQDQASDFSSPGPRVGDFAVKPDIAAPGEEIVAARASGTLDDVAVGEHHARLSGTSMATPHVAGAAAILSAQHPEWRAERLKTVLMNAAQPVAASIYKQGAGRLDVGRAIGQQVTTSPASLSFGAFRWPHDAAPPVSRRVTYRNSGTKPLSLSLRLDVSEPGMFRIDADRVTVPPGGETAVTVTADPKARPVGAHGGRLVATSTDGGTVVQTAVGAYKEPESYDLTVRMTNRHGVPVAPEMGVAGIYDLDDPDNRHQARGGETVRLRRGRYAVVAFVGTAIPGRLERSMTLAAKPEISMDRKTTVHIDARKGKPVRAAVDAMDARVAAAVNAMWLKNEKVDVGALSTQRSDVFAVPTTRSHPHFYYYDRFQLQQPLVRLKVTAPESFEVPVEWAPEVPQITDTRTLTAVHVGHASPEEIAARDVRGKLAVFTLGAGEEEQYDARVQALGGAGASAALFYFSEPISVEPEEPAPIPVAYTLAPEGSRLAKLDTATVTLAGKYASHYRYELAYPSFGRIPGNLVHRTRNHDLAAVRSSYRGLVDGGIAYLNHFPTRSGELEMDWNLWSSTVRVPVERTEYYSPGVRWGHQVGIADHPISPTAEHGFFSAERTYRAGERLSRSWNKAVIGPSMAVSLTGYTEKPHLAFRDGDTIDALLPLFSDSQGHAGLADSATDTGDTSLYADGKLVGRSGLAGEGHFTVPSVVADCRLVAEVTRDRPAWPLSTRVSAEWTFRSAHTDRPAALPLLTVGFDPRLDLRNYAPAGRRFAIPVTVGRQPGSAGGRITLRTVEVSYDDGTTWHRLPVRKTRHGWSVTVTNPASGFVSLQASAADAGGNTVMQTIERAYRVR